MMIKAWKHPIKYLRLVTTPTCDKCRNCRGASMITTYNYRCASRRYLEHVNRLRGTNHGIAFARAGATSSRLRRSRNEDQALPILRRQSMGVQRKHLSLRLRCGKPFVLEKLVEVTYTSRRRIEDMPEGWDGE